MLATGLYFALALGPWEMQKQIGLLLFVVVHKHKRIDRLLIGMAYLLCFG
jgi:hypothetical protein